MQLVRNIVFSLFFLTLTGRCSAEDIRDTAAVRQLLDRGRELFVAGNIDSAEAIYKKAGTLALSMGDDNGFLEYTGRYTGLLYTQLRFEEALVISKQQLAAAQRKGDRRKEANAYNNMALQYLELGQLRTAAEHFLSALHIAESIDDPYNRQKFYTNLSSLFYDLKDKQKSLFYARKGYELAREMNDSVQIGKSMVNLSLCEVLNGLYDSALHHSRMTVLLRPRLEDETVMSAYINIGEILNRKGNHQGALDAYKRAEGMLRGASSPDFSVHIVAGLAATYHYMNDIARAEQCFDRAAAHTTTYLSGTPLTDFYKLGATIKTDAGKPAEALVWLQQYTALNDSLINHATRMSVQEMEIRYQTSEKEKIVAGQQLQISRQQVLLQRRNLAMWIAAGLLLITVLAVGAGYFIRKQKRKVNRSRRNAALLQARLDGEEQERRRTARELHDGVGSTLSAAKMHLYTLPANTGEKATIINLKALELVENALQEIRSLSHNLAPEILLQEGLAYAVKSYCARVSNDELEIQVYITGSLPPITADSQLLLYRVIQEAVNNIRKHSGATQAIVQLGLDGDKLSLVIEDNGKGFDVEQLQKNGIGLHNLLTRIRLLDGDYQLESAPGNGTSLTITLSVDNPGKSGNDIT